MRTQVWKYEMLGQSMSILLPKGAEFLSVELQGERPVMWFRVSPDEEFKIMRQFEIIGTGQDISTDHAYRGTFQMPPYVWHLFEVQIRL